MDVESELRQKCLICEHTESLLASLPQNYASNYLRRCLANSRSVLDQEIDWLRKDGWSWLEITLGASNLTGREHRVWNISCGAAGVLTGLYLFSSGAHQLRQVGVQCTDYSFLDCIDVWKISQTLSCHKQKIQAGRFNHILLSRRSQAEISLLSSAGTCDFANHASGRILFLASLPGKHFSCRIGCVYSGFHCKHDLLDQERTIPDWVHEVVSEAHQSNVRMLDEHKNS